MSIDDFVKKDQEEAARLFKDRIDKIDLGASKSLDIGRAIDEFAFKPAISMEALKPHFEPPPYIRPRPDPITMEEMAVLLDRQQKRTRRMNWWAIAVGIFGIIGGTFGVLSFFLK